MDGKTVGQETSNHEDKCLGQDKAAHTDKVTEKILEKQR